MICLPADPHQLHPARRRLPDNPGSQDPHPHELVLADEDGQPLRLGPAGLTGEGVAGAEAQTGPEGVGVFAWLGKPIDGIFLAALLTVIGYSVNDTVVVFDRVREAWAAAARKVPFARVINRAVLQTVPRTVNTGLGAVFILGALAVLGGGSLTDFAIALLIGIAVGTYSSMFTASPIAVELQARSSART